MEGNSRTEGQIQPKLEHVIVEINRADEQLVSSIKEKMEDASKLVFTFRIAKEQRSKNDKAYDPAKLSIGPFHHGKPALKQMEDHKWRYLGALLNRKPNLEASLDICVKALRESEHRARNCYGEKISLNSNDFVQMMLLDCCFIIELFLKFAIKGLRRRNDQLFITPGLLFELRRDMILLENQIPLFVLQQMFHIVPIPQQCTMSFTELASRFFKNMVPGDLEFLKEKFNQEGYHLLDLIRRCIIPTHPKVQPKEVNSSPKDLDSVRKLRRAGVRFKKAKQHSLLLDVTFENGVLTIPPLKIHECMEELLINLIALESHLEDTQQTTSYAFLMHCLIHSEKDVKYLGERRILSYPEVKDKEKEIAEMFQKLGKEASAKDFYYLRLIEQVKEYNRKSLHAKWEKVKRGYGKTPISFVVFVVVILLLVLTFVGVFFSVLSFFLHRS
ncbi:hypothetical protein PanWU01x14_121420 [Parasponia andersonii]|uniref:Uncharacterized protein n=1 Tax=Parasponia andersonii TaxID=3476 RepID=A0A2P5CV96_PARAD|nr:hypothetical protein PanWU01x14_121420 [Parasponia andersonii]